MQVRVQKWGNSLAVRIPKSFAIEAQFSEETTVDMLLRDGEIVLSPIRHKYTLDELLAGITGENLHGEQDFGPALGQEFW